MNRLGLLCLLSLIPGVARAQAALDARMEARIDSVFAQYTVPFSPGCAVGVVRDGQLAFARGYGMADLQHGIPITPASIFHVASVSKQFAAMAVTLLAAEGKLSLDDEVRTHVAEVPDFGTPITIRHLIHHTSGLRDQWSLLSLAGWRPDDPKSEADILWLVSRQRALNFPPGAEYLYSNTGYTLLGTIVHRVTGQTLREFTQERIFTPLGMASTHFHDDHTMVVPGRTSAYASRGGSSEAGADAWRISIPVFDNAGATSLFTTVEDLARWEAHFLHPVVGGAAVLEQMHERGRLASGEEIPYAFALVHGTYRGLRTIGHSGADAGYRADFLRFPDHRHAFITLCNVASANAAGLNRAVAAIVLERHLPEEPAAREARALPAEIPLPRERAEALIGWYLDAVTEALVRIERHPESGRLRIAGPQGGPQLAHLGNLAFQPEDDPESRWRFEDRLLRITARNGRETDYHRLGPAATAPDALAEFAGRFRSEELDVEWVLSLENDALMVRRRAQPAQRLAAVYADGFSGPGGTYRFTRDAAGRIDGFLLSMGRVRHLRFDRIGPTLAPGELPPPQP
jgi:CubicO group peptidase (beta-lactamase class C family)